jgi:hypothetical protein
METIRTIKAIPPVVSAEEKTRRKRRKNNMAISHLSQ